MSFRVQTRSYDGTRAVQRPVVVPLALPVGTGPALPEPRHRRLRRPDRPSAAGRAWARPAPGEAARRSALMQEYGVARETARKAVRVLSGEGLVYVVQGRGAYVIRRG
jgi:hypothetical protein